MTGEEGNVRGDNPHIAVSGETTPLLFWPGSPLQLPVNNIHPLFFVCVCVCVCLCVCVLCVCMHTCVSLPSIKFCFISDGSGGCGLDRSSAHFLFTLSTSTLGSW